MTIPSYQELYPFILSLLKDEMEWKSAVIAENIADILKLSNEERLQVLPSGGQLVISNRCHWSLFYLKKAGAVKSVKRGVYQICTLGIDLINKFGQNINNEVLSGIESFKSFLNESKDKKNEVVLQNDTNDNESPNDKIENGISSLRVMLIDEVVNRLKGVSPSKFENIVLDVILKMGYGGSRSDAGKVVGKSGDGGIDGVIKEDRLGLDSIYLQAKRWESVVGRPEIQKFAGALQMHRAKKGIFITTSSFSFEAKQFVEIIESKIILIDGLELANLMVEFDVGVTRKLTIIVRDIDLDYYDEQGE